MRRRSLLAGLFGAALGAVAASVSAVRWVAPPRVLILWGDGVRDDTEAFQALVNGKPVMRPDGTRIEVVDRVIRLPAGNFLVRSTLLA